MKRMGGREKKPKWESNANGARDVNNGLVEEIGNRKRTHPKRKKTGRRMKTDAAKRGRTTKRKVKRRSDRGKRRKKKSRITKRAKNKTKNIREDLKKEEKKREKTKTLNEKL